MPIDSKDLIPSLWDVLQKPSPTNTWPLGSPSLAWSNIYLGPNGAPAFNSASGIIGFFPTLGNETGVTNNSYYYGNALRYGADPTGVADSSSALTNAWLSYKTIYIPTGSYSISQLVVPTTNGPYQRMLYGDGKGRSDITITGNEHGILFPGTGAGTVHTVTIQNLGLIGPNSQITLTFTGALSAGATSGTLTSNWTHTTSTYNVTFSDGETRAVVLTNGQTTATWTSRALGANVTATATTGGSGIHFPANTGAFYEILLSDLTITGFGGPAICDHQGLFTSRIERVQVGGNYDNNFDIIGGNTFLMSNCYATTQLSGGKAGYRIHAGGTFLACNGINTGNYGYIFGDLVAEDGVSRFSFPTLLGTHCEDARIIGIRNKSAGTKFLGTDILAPSAAYTVTFTASFTGGETSGTLTANWAQLSDNYYVIFSNGDVRRVTLTNGQTTAQWTTALSGAATASANTGVCNYLQDTTNQGGFCDNVNLLLQTKGIAFAGQAIHTNGAGTQPFAFAIDAAANGYSFFREDTSTTITAGCATASGTIQLNRQGPGFGDSLFQKIIQMTQEIRTRVVVTYSASMTPDCSLGNVFEITANNGTAFTINNPTNSFKGQQITITLKNTSGGALGAITLGGNLHVAAAFPSPANTKNQSVTFESDGTVFQEINRTTADVAN